MKSILLLALVLFSFHTLGQDPVSDKKKSIKNYSKIGINNKFMVTTSQGSGLLYGWRYINYNSEKFFLGGAGYTGQVYQGTTASSFTYGGLMAGYDWHFGTSGKKIELAVLIGSGIGSNTTKTSGGMLIEPSISYSMSLGERTKANLGTSYVYIPGSEDFRGFSVGFTFDILYNN